MRANEGDSLWQLFDSALFDSSTSATEIGLPSNIDCPAPLRRDWKPALFSDLPIEATPPIAPIGHYSSKYPNRTLCHTRHTTHQYGHHHLHRGQPRRCSTHRRLQRIPQATLTSIARPAQASRSLYQQGPEVLQQVYCHRRRCRTEPSVQIYASTYHPLAS